MYFQTSCFKSMEFLYLHIHLRNINLVPTLGQNLKVCIQNKKPNKIQPLSLLVNVNKIHLNKIYDMHI